MNSIVICGRLTRSPEIRYSGSGENTTAIARFSVAVNRRFKREGEPDADFFNVVCFGKNANFAEKYLGQGSKVIIRGSMKQDNYTNKDGQKVYSWNLVADELDFGESKSSGTSASAEEKPRKEKAAEAEPAQEGFMNIPEGEDDFPFA